MNDLRAIMRIIECFTKLSDPGGDLVRLKTFYSFSARKLESVSPLTYSIEMQPERSSCTKS